MVVGDGGYIPTATLESLGLDVVAMRSPKGVIEKANNTTPLQDAVAVVLYGADEGHEALVTSLRARRVTDR